MAREYHSVKSELSVSESINRTKEVVQGMGMHIFAHINHSAGAQSVGLPLRPTQLLLFGHPLGGTPLMQRQQTLGLELPLKMLAWEDERSQVWLSYPNLSRVMDVPEGQIDQAVAKLESLLQEVAYQVLSHR